MCVCVCVRVCGGGREKGAMFVYCLQLSLSIYCIYTSFNEFENILFKSFA